MKITLIACSDKNGLIGKNNQLPFSNSKDMQFFKDYTTNKTILMGRNTWESMNCKPLKNRINLILSNSIFGDNIFSSKEEVLEYCSLARVEELVVIGGASIYELFLEDCEKIILNEVNQEVEFTQDDVVTYFPDFPKGKFLKKETYSDKDVTFNFYVRNEL